MAVKMSRQMKEIHALLLSKGHALELSSFGSESD
jgi:hypothetical protein